MSRESYARGFCKAAEAAGVDPKALAKFAANSTAVVHPPKGLSGIKGVNPSFLDWYNFLHTIPMRYKPYRGGVDEPTTKYQKAIEDSAYEIAPDVVKTSPDWLIPEAVDRIADLRGIGSVNRTVGQKYLTPPGKLSGEDIAKLIYASHTNHLAKTKSPHYSLFDPKAKEKK